MKLLEYQGKELLSESGIHIPSFILTNNKSYVNLSFHKEQYKKFFFENGKVIIKPQVIMGKRSKSGLISSSDNYKQSLELIDQLYSKKVNNTFIDTLLIEKFLNISEEYFLSFSYDTTLRKPVVLFSKNGGVDIEENQNVIKKEFSPNQGLMEYQAREIAKKAGFSGSDLLNITSFILKAHSCFSKFECFSLEINPIIKTKQGLLFAGDAKITIDDHALPRIEKFSHITDLGDKSYLTEREIEARKIDFGDHRGVAGKSFIELNGDIAVMCSGGGGSLTCMDALIKSGGKAANYVEYSGNPSKEKLRKLTQITLDKKDLSGFLVVGGTANFTDIYETLSGVMQGLQNLNQTPKFPIVIRRAGPNDKEAFEMVKTISEKQGYNLYLYGEETPMTKAVEILVQKSKEYKNGNNN